MTHVQASWDGGIRGPLVDGVAPHAACSAILEGGHVYERKAKYLGAATSNAAEWRGLVLVLEIAAEIGLGQDDVLDVYGDSEIVVKQINGVFPVKSENLVGYFDESIRLGREIFERGCEISISHVRREKNEQAHAIVQGYLDGLLWTSLG